MCMISQKPKTNVKIQFIIKWRQLWQKQKQRVHKDLIDMQNAT